MPHHSLPATDTAASPATVASLADGLGQAFGGLLLWLQAAVVIPGLIPGVALTVLLLLLLPFVALAVVAAVVVGVPLGAVRLVARARRRRRS
jgi:hypothetical protein